MKKLSFSTLLLVAFLFPAEAGNELLIGTWKSNRESTLEYLKTHTKLTPPQLEKVGSVLGKMEFIFDAQTWTAKSGDWKFVSKYKVVEESKGVLTIESDDPDTKKPTKTRIELDGRGLWVTDDKIPGYKERFDKVVPAAQAKIR